MCIIVDTIFHGQVSAGIFEPWSWGMWKQAASPGLHWMGHALRTTPIRQQFSGIAKTTPEASIWDAPVVSVLPHQRAIYACPDPLEFGTFQALPLCPGSAAESASEQQSQAEEMVHVWTSAVIQAEDLVPRFKLAQGDVLLIDNFRCERNCHF